MAADSSWSLRGVDPRAREVAREAAKREGVTIGEWLNRQLLEEGDGQGSSPGGETTRDAPSEESEALSNAIEQLSRRIEAAEHRSTLAITNIDQSVLGVISRIEGAQELQSEFADRYSAALAELRETQKALHARIEKMERAGGDAGKIEQLRALEAALGKIAKQVQDNEADTRSRLEAIKEDIERGAKRSGDRIDQVARALDERLADVTRKVESDLSGFPSIVSREVDAASRKLQRDLDATAKRLEADIRSAREDVVRGRREVEALITDRAGAGRAQIEAIETAVTDINSRLAAAERDTDSAIKALERSFSELDARVRQPRGGEGAAEREAFASQIERRFEGLSRELAQTVAATRAEIAAKMVDVARQDGVQGVVTELETLGRRLGDTETRQRQTLARISNEVAKLAGAVEARVRKAESGTEARLADIRSALAAAEETPAAQAAEIARLHARLKSAETKATAAVDAVTRRVDALDERAAPRVEPAEDLSRRIRDSEERTRAMINGALADINRRLDHSDDQIASALSPVQRALDTLRGRLEALESGSPSAAGLGGTAARPAAKPVFEDQDDPLDFSGSLDVADAADLDVAFDVGDLDFELDVEEPAPPKKTAIRHTDEDKRPGDAFVPDLDDERIALESDEEFTLDVEALEPLEVKAEPAAAPGVTEPDVIDLHSDDGEASFDLVFGRSVDDSETQPAEAPAAADGEFDPFADDVPKTEPPVDFMAAAREAARKAAKSKPAKADKGDRASPGFGPVEAPATRAKKGRSLLYAAGGLAFLAVGAAGVIVLKDAAGKSADDGGVADPLQGLFAAPSSSEASPVAAVSPRYVATEDDATGDGAAERSLPVDLAGRQGADFSLYVEGDDLFAPIAPENRSAGAALDAMLTSARAAQAPSVATPAQPPVAPLPSAEGAAPPAEVFEGGLVEPVGADELQEPAGVEDLSAGLAIPAVTTLEEAAAQGDPIAQYELGESLLSREDLEGGVRWIEAAADNGVTAAQYRLGKLHETARGVPEDLPEARRLLERAAEAGHRNAMHSLAILHAEGRGGAQDFESAARWFEEAALLGATDAQFNLAVLYEQGLGVPVSLPDAYAWFAIAGRNGDADAQARAETIAGSLEPQQLESASEAVRRFSPRPLDEAANGVFSDSPWETGGSPLVARIQAALADLGYDAGPADGVMGGRTVEAIRAYQTVSGLSPTGEADAALLEKLEAEADAL